MEAIDGRRKPVFIDMGVYFGRSDTGMTQKFLDDAEIGSAGKKVGGERVAEKVRIDTGVEPCSLSCLFDDAPEMRGGEPATVIAEKYFSSRFCADQFGAGSIEVAVKGVLGRLAKKNEPLFISFSYDTGTASR
jgi:hypothetical protein